jgi:hypothetical protein
MRDDKLYVCRVCGLRQDEPPWGADGKSPTYNYCPCCGVEFGYGDATLEGATRWREKWQASGAQWDDPKAKPEGWNAGAQLQQLPQCYR